MIEVDGRALQSQVQSRTVVFAPAAVHGTVRCSAERERDDLLRHQPARRWLALAAAARRQTPLETRPPGAMIHFRMTATIRAIRCPHRARCTAGSAFPVVAWGFWPGELDQGLYPDQAPPAIRRSAHSSKPSFSAPLSRGRWSTTACGWPVAGAQVRITGVRDDLPNALSRGVLRAHDQCCRRIEPHPPARAGSRTIVDIHRVVGGAVGGQSNISVRALLDLRLTLINPTQRSGDGVERKASRADPSWPAVADAGWRGTHWQTFQQIPDCADGQVGLVATV